MFGWTQCVWLTGISLTLLVLVDSTPAAGQEAHPAVDLQTAVFTAAVKGVVDSLPAPIDPRPIKVYHDPVFPTASHFIAVEPAVLAARAAVLRDLEIEATDIFPLRKGCDAMMAPPGLKDTSGCPHRSEGQLVFDLAECETADRCVIRMIELGYGPIGRNATTYDVVVVRRSGQWVFDRLIPQVIWE